MTPSRNARSFDVTTSLPPVFALDAQQMGMTAQDAIDDDWAEFLSLGLEANPAELGGGGTWKNGPVLLSY